MLSSEADTLAPWERSALKVAAGHLIRAVGGFDVAELVAGRSRATLHGYTDLANPAFMPADVLVRLERALIAAGGRPVVSALLSRHVGYLQVPVPEGGGEIGRAAASAIRRAADVAATHIEALADGVVTDAERAALAAQADALVAEALRLRAACAPPAAAAQPRGSVLSAVVA